MTEFLARQRMRATASGKAILIGEHAAVYGYPALALALPDVTLTVEIWPELPLAPGKTWEDAWQVQVRDERLALPQSQREALTQALTRALAACGCTIPLSAFRPQQILLDSQIPLGAGMGGSAAVSTALVRLCESLLGNPAQSREQLASIANEIDCLFHGRASGLDASAIAAGGVIEFVRGRGAALVVNGKDFWLVLVDAGERGRTSEMVQRVANHYASNGEATNRALARMGALAEAGKAQLRQGDLEGLGEGLNEAHSLLRSLGVSTPKLDSLVSALLAQGALGAKLTGAGGGGLALGLFPHPPDSIVTSLEQIGPTYLTKVARCSDGTFT